MYDALIDPFTCGACGFMQTAALAGALAVVTTSLIGTWIVLRGMTFVGDALAHGVLPGITLAFLLDVNLVLGAAVSAVVMLLGVNLVQQRVRLPEDTGIGLLFVGMLALGVIIASKRASFAGDLTAFLFGDPIAVSSGDLVLQAVAAGVTLVASVVLYRAFLVLSFSREKAAVLGLVPGLANAAMLGLVGLAIVSSFQAVGTLLVFAFIVAPPATAALVVRRVPAMMVAAVGFGLVAVVTGLLVSFHYATAAAATIAGIAVVEFFLVFGVTQATGWRRTALLRRGAPEDPAGEAEPAGS